MKVINWLVAITLIATIALLVLALGDFLALHDIYSEYVSSDILGRLGIQLTTELPAWTATEGEWTMVQVGFYARVLFLLLNALTLSLSVYYLRRLSRKGAAAS